MDKQILGTALLLFALCPPAALAQEPVSDRMGSAEGVVRELYDLVTFEAGQTPDWDAVRALFIPEAVVVLRTSREGTTVFSVETFVGDFVSFIERAQVQKTGFTEEIIRMSPTVMGDMANVWVLYEASIPGSERPPQQGVDNFSLIKKDGRWWVAAVTNEIPGPSRPMPDVLSGN